MLILTQDKNTAINSAYVSELTYSKNEKSITIFAKQGEYVAALGSFENEKGLWEFRRLVNALAGGKENLFRMSEGVA